MNTHTYYMLMQLGLRVHAPLRQFPKVSALVWLKILCSLSQLEIDICALKFPFVIARRANPVLFAPFENWPLWYSPSKISVEAKDQMQVTIIAELETGDKTSLNIFFLCFVHFALTDSWRAPRSCDLEILTVITDLDRSLLAPGAVLHLAHAYHYLRTEPLAPYRRHA